MVIYIVMTWDSFYNGRIMGDYWKMPHLWDLVKFYFVLGLRRGETQQLLKHSGDYKYAYSETDF